RKGTTKRAWLSLLPERCIDARSNKRKRWLGWAWSVCRDVSRARRFVPTREHVAVAFQTAGVGRIPTRANSTHRLVVGLTIRPATHRALTPCHGPADTRHRNAS